MCGWSRRPIPSQVPSQGRPGHHVPLWEPSWGQRRRPDGIPIGVSHNIPATPWTMVSHNDTPLPGPQSGSATMFPLLLGPRSGLAAITLLSGHHGWVGSNIPSSLGSLGGVCHDVLSPPGSPVGVGRDIPTTPGTQVGVGCDVPPLCGSHVGSAAMSHPLLCPHSGLDAASQPHPGFQSGSAMTSRPPPGPW